MPCSTSLRAKQVFPDKRQYGLGRTFNPSVQGSNPCGCTSVYPITMRPPRFTRALLILKNYLSANLWLIHSGQSPVVGLSRLFPMQLDTDGGPVKYVCFSWTVISHRIALHRFFVSGVSGVIQCEPATVGGQEYGQAAAPKPRSRS